MSYYIPLYSSEPITLKEVSNEMEIIEWVNVPEIIQNQLHDDLGRIPESVAVTDNPREIIETEIMLLSFIFGKTYYVYQWADEKSCYRFSTSYSIAKKNPCKLINDKDLEYFLKIALPLSHKCRLQRILSYYYEIMFRTSSVQVKIISLVSLLEFIVNSHSFKEEVVISDEWIVETGNSFINETIRTDYKLGDMRVGTVGAYVF